MSCSLRLASGYVALCLLLSPGMARGQMSQAEQRAMDHDERAQEYFQRGEYASALSEMEAAQGILPASARVYNIAACHERMGNTSEAIAYYQRFIELDDGPAARREQARQRIEELRRRIVANIHTAPYIEPTNGAQAEREYVEPSQTSDGGEIGEIEETTTTASNGDNERAIPPEGEEHSEPEGLEAEPSERSRPIPRAAFYGTLGVTAALALTATITGAVTLSMREEYRSLPRGEGDSEHLQTTGQGLALSTDVLLGVAAAGAIATVVLGILMRRRARDDGSELSFSPSLLHNGAAVCFGRRF